MLTQRELELRMYSHGKHRVQQAIANREAAGAAHNNPYASELYRRYIFPLAALIRSDLDKKKPGRNHAHVMLLRSMDEEAIAFLTVRAILSSCLGGEPEQNHLRKIDAVLGTCIMHEQMLRVFEHVEPALFHTLVEDFGRKLSKSERHRMTVMKMQAKSNGVELPEWGMGDKQRVGAYLVGLAEDIGLAEVIRITGQHSNRRDFITTDVVVLSEEARDVVETIKDHLVEHSKYATPCVEKPLRWTGLTGGGFHTREMQRAYPFCVQTSSTARDYLQEHPSPVLLKAINALQEVPWRINGEMFEIIKEVARHFDLDEILSQAEFPAPQKPHWLMDQTKDQMTPDQLQEFVAWKREKAEWFTQMKLRGAKWGRFQTAMRVATEFVKYPALYFVYFADFRGRLYCRTTGVSPQGSDLQKALLQFSEGKVLSSPEAIRWFKIAGANRWGYDKASLGDRVRWVDERHAQILGMAVDPIGNNEWREADCPLQFLAWCLEYAQWHWNPTTFESRIAVGMDGSCNGLQNFSAMLRDELGGRATNLVPSALPSDIYAMVAKQTEEALKQADDDEDHYRTRWLKHGINRTLVKRSVMTLPYGSTRFSCAQFIVDDYLKQGKATEFAKDEYSAAAQYLSHFVWDSIGIVVVKARHAMDWLQSASNAIFKEGAEGIQWVTPSGFPVVQHYWEVEEHRIMSRLHGGTRLKVVTEVDTPNVRCHRNGIAPNFIHSMDAAHLALTTSALIDAGVTSLAMIHDDYGTHAADAPVMYETIRRVFVDMYTDNDPLEDFRKCYPFLPDPPAKGALDLQQVLQSPYFFS